MKATKFWACFYKVTLGQNLKTFSSSIWIFQQSRKVSWHRKESQSHRILETNMWNPHRSFSLNSQFRLNLMQKNQKTQLQQSTKQTNKPTKEKYSGNYFFLRNSAFHKKLTYLSERATVLEDTFWFTLVRKCTHSFLFSIH